MRERITGTVTSEKGFYIGDICYALNSKVYDEVWGGCGYMDGIHEVPGTGRSFAVAGTAYGDGTYEDDHGRDYGVDAGVIGIVPGELAESTDGGHYFEGAGTATFEAVDGMFDITLPNGTHILINTGDYEEEEDYWDYEEEEGYWEEDDECEEEDEED